jgi:hypothetical protein
MKLWQPTVLCLALAAAFQPAAHAQSMDEMRQQLKALKDQINALEQRLKASEAKTAAQPATAPERQWGMTPEQSQELNRIVVKTEALEDSRDALGFKGLKISGQMDPTFIYNRNQNRAGFQFLDPVSNGYNYDNSYFGMAMLDIVKEMEDGTRWKLTLAPNRGVGSVMLADNSIVHEASVSIPLGDQQTRLIAGQIPDWSGYEYLQPTLNKLITHNLLFDFTLPTAYTGAGLELTRGKWIVKAMLANLNSTARSASSKMPIFAYRVDYSKGEYQGFGFAGINGKANEGVNGSGNSSINLLEFDGYFIRGDWTLQGQVSGGMQKRGAVAPKDDGTPNDASWWGLSALAAYKFQPRLEGIVRADYLNNARHGGGLLGYGNDNVNGIGQGFADDGTGTWAENPDRLEKGANRYALSIGLGYLYNLNTTFKVEYRLDGATEPVFVYVKDGTYRKTNQVFGTSVVVSF